MILTIKDRVIIPELLPEQGSMLEMIIVNSINKKVMFTPREITEFELTQEGESLKWNTEKNTDVEVFFEESEINLLKERYKKLDEEKRISRRTFDLCMKISNL